MCRKVHITRTIVASFVLAALFLYYHANSKENKYNRQSRKLPAIYKVPPLIIVHSPVPHIPHWESSVPPAFELSPG